MLASLCQLDPPSQETPENQAGATLRTEVSDMLSACRQDWELSMCDVTDNIGLDSKVVRHVKRLCRLL
jgi:hypothetical protein